LGLTLLTVPPPRSTQRVRPSPLLSCLLPCFLWVCSFPPIFFPVCQGGSCRMTLLFSSRSAPSPSSLYWGLLPQHAGIVHRLIDLSLCRVNWFFFLLCFSIAFFLVFFTRILRRPSFFDRLHSSPSFPLDRFSPLLILPFFPLCFSFSRQTAFPF